MTIILIILALIAIALIFGSGAAIYVMILGIGGVILAFIIAIIAAKPEEMLGLFSVAILSYVIFLLFKKIF